MKRLLRCVAGAALVLALGLGAAQATQYTNQVPLGVLAANNWTDLGAGPLTVSAASTSRVKIALSDTQPAAGFGGELLTVSRHFENTSHVWALAYQGTAASVTVTNESSGVAGGSSTTLPSSIGSNQAKIATTGTAVQIPASPAANGLLITASPANVGTILVGGSTVSNVADGTGNGYELQPGSSVIIPVSNFSAAYINGTAGDHVSFLGN